MKVYSLKDESSFKQVNKVGFKFYSKHFIIIAAKLSFASMTKIASKKLITNYASTHKLKSLSLKDIYSDTELMQKLELYYNTYPIKLLGLKVSKKFGSAVKRNKAKRRSRMLVSNIDSKLNTFILIPKPSFETINYKILEGELCSSIISLERHLKKQS